MDLKPVYILKIIEIFLTASQATVEALSIEN